MGRSGKIIATNDHFIEELINDPLYDIRSDGSIWTRVSRTGQVFIDENKWRRLDRQKGLYKIVKYKRKSLQAHRIIYRKFNGALSSDLVISHINNNGLDNRPVNLKLDTQSNNNYNAYKDDNRLPSVSNNKITFEIAQEMRLKYLTGKYTYTDLMKIYGLTSKGTISGIINGHQWNPELHQKY